MNGNGNGTNSTQHPVIVVGAGPAGLLLAGDLATAGVPVTLLEKRPHRISNLSRAFVLHARTLEQLDARGLADGLESVGRRLDSLRLFGRLTVELGTPPLPLQPPPRPPAVRGGEGSGAACRRGGRRLPVRDRADRAGPGRGRGDGRGPRTRRGGAPPARRVRRRHGRHAQCRARSDRAALPRSLRHPFRRPRGRTAGRGAREPADRQRRRRRLRLPRAVRRRLPPRHRLEPGPRRPRQRAPRPRRGQGGHPARPRP